MKTSSFVFRQDKWNNWPEIGHEVGEFQYNLLNSRNGILLLVSSTNIFNANANLKNCRYLLIVDCRSVWNMDYSLWGAVYCICGVALADQTVYKTKILNKTYAPKMLSILRAASWYHEMNSISHIGSSFLVHYWLLSSWYSSLCLGIIKRIILYSKIFFSLSPIPVFWSLAHFAVTDLHW